MTILEFIDAYLKSYLFIVAIPFIALGFVYIIGRFLNFVKDFRWKNAMAILVIFGAMYYYMFQMQGYVWGWTSVGYWVAYSALSIVFYALICFRLFDRIDSVLDKKLGQDHGFNIDEKKAPSKKKGPRK